MTVRAWFTISAVVILLLAGAVTYRLLAPVATPAILARSGDARLEGEHVHSCWPQRGGRLRCRRSTPTPNEVVIPASGTLGFVVAYPVQPDEWQITIANEDRTVIFEESDEVGYELQRGSYRIDAQARYSDDAFVQYLFSVRVR